MKYLLILLPKVMTEPKFDLINAESGIERELTKEEQNLIDVSKQSVQNFDSVHAKLYDLDISGEYKDIISHEKAPIVLKDGIEYQLYCLSAERIKAVNLAEQLASIFKDSNIAVITDDSQAWLRKNGYEYPKNMGI